MKQNEIVILGIFVADAAFRADRQPNMGETIIGKEFILGPGGKGSNQAVAAARLGSNVGFISRIGDDAFGQLARDLWSIEGISPLIDCDSDSFTGCAYIYIDASSGDNAIIVVPGAATKITVEDLEKNRSYIECAKVFMTQLETPVDVVHKGMKIANDANVTTVFNPAPAIPLSVELISLCDYLIPNESEAAILTGIPDIGSWNAKEVTKILRDQGAGTVILTLGENGAYIDDGVRQEHVLAIDCGKVVETTGAGDAFCGAFAHALVQGMEPFIATRFAVAAASLSVTRPGTAPSMPTIEEFTRFHGASLALGDV